VGGLAACGRVAQTPERYPSVRRGCRDPSGADAGEIPVRPARSQDPSGALNLARRLDIVKARKVDRADTVGRRPDDIDEASVVDDVTESILVVGVHRLPDRLVVAGEHGVELGA
jgi:hypothetical protein